MLSCIFLLEKDGGLGFQCVAVTAPGELTASWQFRSPHILECFNLASTAALISGRPTAKEIMPLATNLIRGGLDDSTASAGDRVWAIAQH